MIWIIVWEQGDSFATLIAILGIKKREIYILDGSTWNGRIKYGEKFGPVSIDDKE